MSDSYDYDRNVVVAAQKSFNECRALELAGVHVSHSVQEPRSVIIRVDYNPDQTKVDFRSMVYDPSVATCYSTGLSKGGTRIKITSETKEVKEILPFDVACERIGIKTASGETKFERFAAATPTGVAFKKSE